MSTITRTFTFQDALPVTGSDLDNELSNIVSTWNYHDNGTLTWNNVKVTTLSPQANVAMGGFKLTGLGAGSTAGDSLRYEQLFGGDLTLIGNLIFNPTTKGVKGTTTNDNTATGNVGEYVASVTTSAVPAASGNYSDATSITLTAGDWDVSVLFDFLSNGATWTTFIAGIGTVTGNDGTGISVGDSASAFTIGSSSTSVTRVFLAVPAWRASISGSTTYYLKANATYSLGTPSYNRARISARRVR